MLKDEGKIVRKSNLSFNKFVEDIVKREDERKQNQKDYEERSKEDPIRELHKRYRERPSNRIKYRR